LQLHTISEEAEGGDKQFYWCRIFL